MGILMMMLGAIGNMILAVIVLLKIIIGILAVMLGLQLYDRFNIRERLARRKKGICRVVNNADQRIINFFDNRK